MSDYYVYLIQAGVKKNCPVKIGMSKNPKQRIKTLQTGNPKPLRILMQIRCNNKKHALDLEKTLHRLLVGQNVLFEWFKLTRSNVLKVLNQLSKNPDFEQIEDLEGLFSYEERDPYLIKKEEHKGLKLSLAEVEISLKRRKKECGIMYRLLSERGLTTKETKQIIENELGTRQENVEKELSKY